MGERVKKVMAGLGQAREEVVEKLDHTIQSAGKIVEEGSTGVAHHDIPTRTQMLPFQVGHCPLASQPLYLPPSVAHPQRRVIRSLSRKIFNSLKTRAENVKNRSIRDMEEFSGSRNPDKKDR